MQNGGQSGVRLRPSAPADLDFITTLERHPDNRGWIGQWSDAEHLAAIAGEGARSHWIIERDGERAGYLIAYDCRGAGADIYVKRILVKDKSRGTGRMALDAFVAKAFQGGADAVWLIVRDTNARAQAMYRAVGFGRFEPADASRYDSAAEPPAQGYFRMRRAR